MTPQTVELEVKFTWWVKAYLAVSKKAPWLLVMFGPERAIRFSAWLICKGMTVEAKT